MTQYDSKIVKIAHPKTYIFEKLSNIKGLESFKDRIPEDYRDKMSFGDDFISFQIPKFSTNVVLRMTSRSEDRLNFDIEDLPIPAKFQISLEEDNTEATNLKTSIAADIPFFMKPMISSKIQPALDMLADTFAKIL